jgi:YfaZ precursor
LALRPIELQPVSAKLAEPITPNTGRGDAACHKVQTVRRTNLLSLSSVVILCSGMLGQALPALGEEPMPYVTATRTTVSRALEATFGNDIAQVTYYTPAPIEGVQAALDYGALIATSRQFIGSSALLFRSDLGLISNFELYFGPKAYLAFLQGEGTAKSDVAAIAGGVSTRVDLYPPWGVAVFGSFFYSPNVLTFGSANNLYDLTAGAEARIASQLVAVGGYRWLKFTLQLQSDNRLSNELFIGVRWQFR